MGWKLGRKLKKLGKKAKRVGGRIASSDLVQKGVALGVSSFVPGGAGLVSGYQTAARIKRTLSPKKKSYTGGSTMGRSSMPSFGLVGKTSGPGLMPRGPGGKLQWPWQDPSIPSELKNFSCDDGYLKITVRAPRGFVVWRTPEGEPFGLWKPVAKMMGWKPKRKPPISVRDWSALTRADRTVNKLKGIVKRAKNLKSVKSL